MPMYRKKPVAIEARQVPESVVKGMELAAWCGGKHAYRPQTETTAFIMLETLEGDMRADVGDWIIKGVKGEFYPIKAEIFKETYEAVEPAESWVYPEPGAQIPGPTSGVEDDGA